MKYLTIRSILTASLILFLATLPILGNLRRIMTYNIKDFWLRFDGESGTITTQGVSSRPRRS